MDKKILISFLFIQLVNISMGAQSENKLVRRGNKEYEKKKFNEAEIFYRKALEKHDNFSVASYNLGNALYRENKFEEAAEAYKKAIAAGFPKNNLAKAYHNIGNAYLQSKKYAQSIEAYKQALRLNPKDLETKYNLALAQKLLKNPPEQNQPNNQQGNNQNQQNQNQQNQNSQNNQNQNNQNDQNKQNNDNQNKNNENKNDKQNQGQSDKMTKEQAQQLLEAIQNDENNTQDKVKKEKARGIKTKPDKNW